MATVNKIAEKMVKIRLFKDGGKYKHPVPVGVNGKQYLVQRGVEVEVPESVAEVLNNSMAQDLMADDMMKEMQKGADW
jgi:hypothetical protein